MLPAPPRPVEYFAGDDITCTNPSGLATTRSGESVRAGFHARPVTRCRIVFGAPETGWGNAGFAQVAVRVPARPK